MIDFKYSKRHYIRVFQIKNISYVGTKKFLIKLSSSIGMLYKFNVSIFLEKSDINLDFRII